MASTYTRHGGPGLGTDGKVYDFIEVGTADHTTITHWCANDKKNASSTCAEIGLRRKDLGPACCARGLAVDPSSHHLAALPNLPNVHKVQVAMDECCGQDDFYFVSQENIERNTGKFHSYFSKEPDAKEVDVFWYAGSLGSLGTPHPNLFYMLQNIGRSNLLEKKVIEVYDWRLLCEKYQVGYVDIVQLDCEGKDCGILRGMLNHHRRTHWPLPRVIKFEANHLTSEEEIQHTLESLAGFGYKVRYRGWYNILLQRDVTRLRRRRGRRRRKNNRTPGVPHA